MTHELGSLALPFPEPKEVQPVAWLTWVFMEISTSPDEMDCTPNLPPEDLSDCVEGLSILPLAQTKLPLDSVLIYQEFLLALHAEILKICPLLTSPIITTLP